MSDLAASLPLLHDTLPANAGLTLSDKRILVNQAKVLIEQVYVHIHLKKALYAIDPVQALVLLQYRLENPNDAIVKNELEFHRELLGVFTSLHDLHTNYILPAPYSGFTAILPLLIEECFDDKQQAHYIVTKISNAITPDAEFKNGVEILLWNGLPITEAIRLNGENAGGSNAAARYAVGLRSLTVRPLVVTLPPLETRIYLQYRTLEGKVLETSFAWLALRSASRSSVNLGTGENELMRDLLPSPAQIYREFLMGNQLQGDYINQARKLLFVDWRLGEEPATPTGEIKSLLSTVTARTVTTPNGTYGYLRLFSFMVESDQVFINEVMRVLKLLPQTGLILDVRGNSGGLITAAERLLQLLTPNTIEPEKAQFLSTPLIREMCLRNSPSPLVPQINLKEWVPSLKKAPVSGTLYSTAHPLTTPQEANNIGQVYRGPVVLVTDAHCYSATDIFAAGFRDHQIGKILGASDNTGAGGANVWQHMILRVLGLAPSVTESTDLKEAFVALPRMADFRISSRRVLRVGEQAGMPLEDFGVEPDERHYMTRADILSGNQDLIQHAAKLLAAQTRYQLDIDNDTASCELKISTQKLDRIDWYINERPAGSLDISEDKAVIKLSPATTERTIRVEGFWKGKKMLSKKLTITCQ